MKHKLLYLLPLLLALGTGCLKSSMDNTLPPPPAPSGTFKGQFRYIHRKTDKVPFDTLKANITLNMLTTNNTYTVTGDTATVHAGSYGTFSRMAPYLIFTDITNPATGTPLKKHLNGAYIYYYDGTTFQMQAYSSDPYGSDTLRVQYDLKKVN
jgi:hypothetical protein